MNRVFLYVAIVCALALWACAGRGGVVRLQVPEETAEPEKVYTFESLTVIPPEESITASYEADDAPKCPRIKVSTWDKRTEDIQPYFKDEVTLVVFWNMDFPASRAAGKHAADLHWKYRGLGLNVVGVVEKTKGYEAVQEFAQAKHIRYPVYYDDLSALKRMSKSVGMGQAVPSFFIVGPNSRVRFCRRGFSFSSIAARGSGRPAATEELVTENAPAGDKIEDYVKRLLEEKAAKQAAPAQE